jgi:hypothetical protein
VHAGRTHGKMFLGSILVEHGLLPPCHCQAFLLGNLAPSQPLVASRAGLPLWLVGRACIRVQLMQCLVVVFKGEGGVSWHALLCVDRFFFLSRPESVVICMTDDDFVRVVGDKGKEEKGICDWRKIIRIIFDQSTILPNFGCRCPPKISRSDRVQCLI